MAEPVAYTYAVLQLHGAEGLTTVLDGVRGVAGAHVHLVPESSVSGLAAAVGPVPAEDFQEDALRRHLEDLDWLETVARAHHTVIEALAAHTTVLPLRLATVYRDDERVQAVLHEEAEVFTQALRRLAGHLEWGVKIYVEPPSETEAADGAGTTGGTDGLTAGRAYLRARRAQRHARDDSYQAAREAADRVEAIGRELAAGHARHRVQQGQLAAGTGENVVNDAYLVARTEAEHFRDRVREAAQDLPGVRIDVTGPWAPYSFASAPGAESPVPDPAP